MSVSPRNNGQLALLGGEPVRAMPYPAYVTVGEEEKRAVGQVIESGVLSDFVGNAGPKFLGGERVRKLESKWAELFGYQHAVSFNSATSGLFAAMGAVGVGPGDEVICPPWTMTCSPVAALVNNAIPVFADLEPELFCLDPEAVEAAITPQTKAIMAVDITGQCPDMRALRTLADAHDLRIVQDSAQTVGATYFGEQVGNLADIAVFSLNCHKNIQCGEGGIAVTNDPDLALRLQLIRNHGEMAIANMESVEDLTNIVGFNYRMTELEAAVAYEQVLKLDRFLIPRQKNARYLSSRLAELPGIYPPIEREGATHTYYTYAIRVNEAESGVSRDLMVKALKAEGMEIGAGTCVPLYLLPMYQRRLAYGAKGCPFTCGFYQGQVSYERGICPTAERLHEVEVMTTNFTRAGLGEAEMDEFTTAVEKVIANAGELAREFASA